MKTKQTEFVRKLKAIKRWLELKGVIEQLGITKEDLENNSPFVVIHFVQDYLDRYGITENQFCEMLDNFAKVGFAKSGIFMYHPTNEKFVVMKSPVPAAETPACSLRSAPGWSGTAACRG